jgi:localization factor PodJL
MAPEPSWQLSNAEAGAGAPFSDQESVESLLRRLIQRVEESERRYDEALGDLHARLDRLSQTEVGAGTGASPEEAETLERLREQLSGLARRYEPAPEPAPDAFAALDKALAEFRAVSARLAAAETSVFPPQETAASEPVAASPAPDFGFPVPSADPSDATAAPPLAGDHDFEQRLIDMAHRLDHSIGEGAPAAAIETLNARMDELAANFEAALQQGPKLESLHRIERQIDDMAHQLGRAEQHIARIGTIEAQLQRLIDDHDQTPAQMQGLASQAATDAARLVAEAALGKPSAAERLDIIHRDLVAMNERGQVTDDRMVDTLQAMHASLKGLVEQAEQAKAPSSAQEPEGLSPAATQYSEPEFSQGAFDGGEDERLRSLRDRLATSDFGFESEGPNPPFGRAKRSFAEETVDFDAIAPAATAPFVEETSFQSMEDLVAAARRAAQAAAARAEERGTRPRETRPADASLSPSRGEPERRKRSLLMVIAALLLIASAVLLYGRLKLKPDFAPAPATEQSVPVPGIGAAPLPSPSP